MLSKPFVTTLIVMLVLVYMGALAVSTAHLSQLYALFNAGLPYSVSIGLAVALEAAAFLFSIISTSLGKKAGPWTAWASTSALLLVWAGNGYAMLLAAPTQPWYIVLGASCFVPVCTLFIGKVLGALFGLLNRLDQPERETLRETTPAPVAPPVAVPLIAAVAARHSTEDLVMAFQSSAHPPVLNDVRLPDNQPVAPVLAVELEQTAEPGPTPRLPGAPVTETAQVPGVPGVHGPSPKPSGNDQQPVDPSPASPRVPDEDQEDRGAGRNGKAQEKPGDVTGLRACTDEALGRVRLSRADLKRLAGTLEVHEKAKVKAEQRVLAHEYNQAGVAVTQIAAELGCDESTLRAALKQTKAALPAAGKGKPGL